MELLSQKKNSTTAHSSVDLYVTVTYTQHVHFLQRLNRVANQRISRLLSQGHREPVLVRNGSCMEIPRR